MSEINITRLTNLNNHITNNDNNNNSHYTIPDLVIYHGGCPDGIAGAWCFWEYILRKDDTKFYAGVFHHTISLELVKDKHVVFVDFTYRKPVMLLLLNEAKSITVLDHHATANDLNDITNTHHISTFNLHLDMNRSGAQMAWDYVHPHLTKQRPWFIEDVADRDLWKWQIELSKQTTRAMGALGYYDSIESFSKINKMPREHYTSIGTVLTQSDDKQVADICKRAIECTLTSVKDPSKKWKVKLVETEYIYISDVGNMLVADNSCDFSVMYSYNILKKEWRLSCRASNTSSIDLSQVAKYFDYGGGHAKAVGITLYESKGQTLSSIVQPIIQQPMQQPIQQPIQ